MKKHLQLLILVVHLQLFFTNAISQCITEQLLINESISGSSVGQSFIPCSSGLLEELEFKTGHNWHNPFTVEIRDADCNTIWTVSDITGPGTYQLVSVDLSAGSGITRNLTEGEQYIFCIPGFLRAMEGHTENVYTDGAATFGTLCQLVSNYDFWFRVGIGQPLPVELIYFKANIGNDGVELNWQTASEINNRGFEVQRSIDGTDWEVLSFIDGKGTTEITQQYQYIDQYPLVGTNYYRLKQLDYDGTYEYSDIKTTKYNPLEKVSPISISPNPVVDLLTLRNSSSEKVEVEVFTLSGILVRKLSISAFDKVILPIDDLDNGIYFTRIKTSNEFVIEKLIKTDIR